MGAMWRWRAPVLNDIVAFFTQFGAFPSGAPRQAYVPEPPEGVAAQGPAPIARTETEPASAEAVDRKAATGSDETR